MNNLRVAFVHGRPQAHPAHIKYAKALKADFYFVDNKIRYHDLPASSSLRRYTSWIVNAFIFPKKKYDVIFSEEAYFPVGLMRWMRLLSKKQKIVALMSTHTLYFLYTDQYAPLTKKASIQLLKTYDGFICGSLLQKELLLNLIGSDTGIPIYTFSNGVEPARLQKLLPLQPNLASRNIIFIGAVPNSSRAWYKGLDLMLAAFRLVKPKFPDLTFSIIGDYDPGLKEELLNHHCPEYKSAVTFTGNVSNIENYLQEASLYLHISRGEAWGISVTEAMAAGVIPLVSDTTGAMEAVVQVAQGLVTSSDVKQIAHKIAWYLELPLEEKKALSDRCKDVVATSYKEEDAINNFNEKFGALIRDLGVYKELEV